jgi:hypothetical protein
LTPQAERFEEFEEAVGGKYPAVMTREAPGTSSFRYFLS